ncbi:hypothetical protein EMPS_06815 [Entomortierella parvispora]|uniref:WD40 repeat-like protein n=1 Tax=Entomortierella parvispora TaxID=205924 RepID=A0A9P3HD56_9FUNG|nr:hypothetical protein EMPS_06815 [Entomortierella parvispora]
MTNLPHSARPPGSSGTASARALAPSSAPTPKTKESRLAAKFKTLLNSTPASTSGPNSQSSTPALSLRQEPKHDPIGSNIFRNNVSKNEVEIQLPAIGGRIEETQTLVYCASLLAETPRPPSPTSSASSSSTSSRSSPSTTLSVSSVSSYSSAPQTHQDWKQKMESQPVEKDHILRQLERVVDKFVMHPTKDAEAVREVVLLGSVLDVAYYRKLLNCFLRTFHKTPVLDFEVLQGLVQLVEDAQPGSLRPDDMVQILRSIRWRLEDPAQQSDEGSIYLTVAISRLLDVMASQKIQDLSRVQEHEPLLRILTGLKTNKDPFLRYQSVYTFQALQWVPDDENALQCSLRHFAGMSSGHFQMAGASQLDLNEVIEGLQDVQKSVIDTCKFIKAGFEDVSALFENGLGLFDGLREGLDSGQKALWYITLRSAKELARKGQFADLNKLICEAPSHHGYLFQWGVCQLLGEAAVDPSWDDNTRLHAVVFLGALYKTNEDSKDHQNLRRWVATILQRISECLSEDPSPSTGDSRIQTWVKMLTQDIEKRGDKPFSYPYPLTSRLPPPKSSLLLKEVNSAPNLDLHLSRFREERLQAYDSNSIYIPPMSKPSLQASGNNLVPLAKRVGAFLGSRREVMLILGDSGAGKSIFNRHLEHDLWEKYQLGESIPLFIDLKAVDNPDSDMIQQHLKQLGMFSAEQIDELKKSAKFILICDGYDECRKWTNLYVSNQLNKPGQWAAKMLVSCRSQYLAPNYRRYLEPQPEGSRGRGHSDLYEEAVIVPFDEKQIRAYIEQFKMASETREISSQEPVWTADEYMDQLERITNMSDLVKNPFLLKILLDILPTIDSTATKVTRARLYDEFVEQHFENELDRLTTQSWDEMNLKEHDDLPSIEANFIELGVGFSRDLSESMFKENDGANAVKYSGCEDDGTWKTAFFGPDAKAMLLRQSSLLVCRTIVQKLEKDPQADCQSVNSASMYAFTHRSILEYFYSCRIFDPRKDPHHLDLAACLTSSVSPPPLFQHPFVTKDLVPEQSIINFLCDRVQQSEEFKNQLRAIVELSKTVPLLSQAAANAITILVQGGVSFHGTDLRGIQVPGANLTAGLFDSAQLQGANLNRANLTQAWLRQADLSDAQMEGACFGEKPAIDVTGFRTCAVSLDGNLMVIAHNKISGNGRVGVFDISVWKEVRYFGDHVGHVWSVDITRSGSYIASGGVDSTVRIRSLEEGGASLNLKGHSGSVNDVSFSPNERQLASASSDTTVRIWDVETGDALLVLEQHKEAVLCVAWSPIGKIIATASSDGEVRLWNLKTRLTERVLDTNAEPLKDAGLSFSPNGHRLVSSANKELRLWDLRRGGDAVILKGHTEEINSVAFSRDGQRIASAGQDRSVRLWTMEAGAFVNSWTGHAEWVKCVVFLNDREVVSGTEKAIKIWELGKEEYMAGHSLELPMHDDEVTSVFYSPDGHDIFSCGRDNAVRQWSAETGYSRPLKIQPATQDLADYTTDSFQFFISGTDLIRYDLHDAKAAQMMDHLTESGNRVAYSKCGQWVATWDSDQLIRLINVHTGAKERVLSGHSDVVTVAAFSPNGRQLVTSGFDRAILVWDTETAECTAVWDYESHDIAYSPCGAYLAMADWATLHIWDFGALEFVHSSCLHEFAIESIAWSPCGEWIATAGIDCSVRLWKKQMEGFNPSWTCKTMIREFLGEVTSVAWNQAARLEFVTGSKDRSICVWRVVENETGTEVEVNMVWGSFPSRLNCTGARINDVSGLGTMEKTLLLQKQAIEK